MSVTQILPAPPADREELLSIAGADKKRIYEMVRRILDDLETTAPWGKLYYPPTEVEEFVRMEDALLEIVGGIPQRVDALRVQMLEDATKRLLQSVPSQVLEATKKEVLLDLVDGTGADSLNQSMKRMAESALDEIPEDVLDPSLKVLIRSFLNRDQVPALSDLDDEALEDAVDALPDEVMDGSGKQTLDAVSFFFLGIHNMVSPDMVKLEGMLTPYREGTATEIGADERAYTCEVSADLKGKYASSIMGAASNLISDGRWEGAEIEPILFPEKAEEFDRNDQLVATLRDVMQGIKRMSAEVGFERLVKQWEERERVDRYALTLLYGFLGDLGKLMREESRRALYSGDYHQIQRRESMLATRINELNTLHNMTWGVIPPGADADVGECYPKMIRAALELATILDKALLQALIGGDTYKALLGIVSIEAERKKELSHQGLQTDDEELYITEESREKRSRIAARLHVLIPLLYEEDLQTFLELLLGSVLKRGSFAVRARIRQREQGATMAPPVPDDEPQPLDVDANEIEIVEEAHEGPRFEPPPPLDEGRSRFEPSLWEAGMEARPEQVKEREAEEGPTASQKLRELEQLKEYLRELASTSNSHRKGFDLIHRFLSQGRTVPPPMLAQMRPFIQNILDILLPQLALVTSHGDMPKKAHENLQKVCQVLNRPDLSAEQIKSAVGVNMERVLKLLDRLQGACDQLIDRYSVAAAEEDFFS